MKHAIMSGYRNALNVSTVEYNQLMGGLNWTAVENTVYQIIPTDGVLSKLSVLNWNTDWGGDATKGYDLEIMVNGVASGVLCQPRGADGFTQDAVNTVEVLAGDRVGLRSTPQNTPLAPYCAWGCEFESDTAKESIWIGSASLTGWGALNYPAIMDVGKGAGDPAYSELILPTSGTLKSLYLHRTVAPGVGNTITFEVWKNGAATGVTITFGAADIAQSDLVNTVAVAAGDAVCFKRTHTGAPDAGWESWGLVFLADNDGEYVVGGGGTSQFGGVADTYSTIYNEKNSTTAEERTYSLAPVEVLAKKIYVELDVAPGAGKDHDFTLRDDGGNTILTTQISDAAIANNAAADVIIAQGSFVNYLEHPTSTPAGAYALFGVLFYAESLGWTGKISGVTDPAKIAGVLVADIATVKGVA